MKWTGLSNTLHFTLEGKHSVHFTLHNTVNSKLQNTQYKSHYTKHYTADRRVVWWGGHYSPLLPITRDKQNIHKSGKSPRRHYILPQKTLHSPPADITFSSSRHYILFQQTLHSPPADITFSPRRHYILFQQTLRSPPADMTVKCPFCHPRLTLGLKSNAKFMFHFLPWTMVMYLQFYFNLLTRNIYLTLNKLV